ncbi:MAG TPA: hypothetical protein PKD53_26175, partial [Chloroflexaceae bacterium]|nr:hypothetical protein [Chloroflexaceae bacterium]
MRCDDAQILLSTRRDLNMSQRAELDAHMGTCRACAAARREEERVSRLLAQLPDPGLAAPPRVAAAVAARVARRSAHERRTHGLALAASLGAVALVAAVLLNIVTGGALGRLIAGGPREQPAAQGGAAAPSASAAARGDLLYLIHRPGQGAARLSAWEPAADRTLFSVPLGEPPPYIPSDQPATFVSVPPRDVALAPDGRRLYVIEYGERIDLVAYDARGGAELWRSALTNYAPFITLEGGGSLTVSPDGARVFVRQVSSQPRLGSALIGVALRAFAADDGRELGPTTELLPETVLVFPLSQHSALTVTSGGMTARIPLD